MGEWINLTQEAPFDRTRRIIDCHHHLWAEGHRKRGFTYSGNDEPAYLPEHFHGDMHGHNFIGSVFVQCAIAYYEDGPEHLRPVGETEYVAGLAHASAGQGPPLLGIVAHTDISRLDVLDEVLDGHLQAGAGLLCGIRQMPFTHGQAAPRNLMTETSFRDGMRMLGDRRLAFDVMLGFDQLDELARFAPQVEGTTIVVDHLGVPMLRSDGPSRPEVTALWRENIRKLVPYRNVMLKLGGIGMERAFGMTWSKQPHPPTSDQVFERWHDEVRFCIDTLGPDRCMFESNFPVDRWAVGYTVLWNSFQKMAKIYTDAEQDALFFLSACRAYQLELPNAGLAA